MRALQPSIVLLENVPGILRDSFVPYLEYITRQIEFLSIGPRPDESWEDHDDRLKRHMRSHDPIYRVQRWTLNAADYGVAQARVRVFLIASRADLNLDLRPPSPTNSRAALLNDEDAGIYWRDRNLPVRRRRRWPVRVHGTSNGLSTQHHPWVTVRDALQGLPAPSPDNVDGNNHWLIPGARLYRGHTGSELDWPAKTIKAGVHGVAGGENILLLDRGRYRYFTLRELARLQGFPDDYHFIGPRSRIIAQIGNAVPCGLATVIGLQLRRVLRNIQNQEVRVTTRDHSCSSLHDPVCGQAVGVTS